MFTGDLVQDEKIYKKNQSHMELQIPSIKASIIYLARRLIVVRSQSIVAVLINSVALIMKYLLLGQQQHQDEMVVDHLEPSSILCCHLLPSIFFKISPFFVFLLQ